MEELGSFIHRIKALHPLNKIVLTGDYNMPEIKWNDIESSHLRPFQRDFLSVIDDLNLTQLVLEPTHGNILDLIFTDLDNLIYDICGTTRS